MPVTVHFTKPYLGRVEDTFENFTHLREILLSYYFAPVYRMKTHRDEWGKTTGRDLYAVHNDGTEVYIGGIELSTG